MNFDACTDLLKLLAEPARLRLLLLLQRSELTVAELAQITGMQQPRVSTHLAKLKEAQVVLDRRAGVQAFYRAATEQLSTAHKQVLDMVCQVTDDAIGHDDQRRLERALQARHQDNSWADQVAGDMERHYSPGRTWEAITRTAVQLLELGDVLDIASGDGALAELLAPRSRSMTCVDASAKVVQAATRRLSRFSNVQVLQADMHELALRKASIDLALLMQALPYSDNPTKLFANLRPILRRGGKLLGTALFKHSHEDAVTPFGHRNLGFTQQDLSTILQATGFQAIEIQAATRERKAPHFDVFVFSASNP